MPPYIPPSTITGMKIAQIPSLNIFPESTFSGVLSELHDQIAQTSIPGKKHQGKKNTRKKNSQKQIK